MIPTGLPLLKHFLIGNYNHLVLVYLSSGMQYAINVFPGATDSRHYRSVGLPSYGISPFPNTPILLHDHNEFLNSQTYLHGIVFYEKVLQRLGSQ